MTPAQYLQLFFDRDLLNFIVEQSVIYHTQKKLRCQQLTIELLARFLGFLLYAGCVPLPGKEYYWQSSTRQEQVTEHLSRNEMHAVKAQIHFANNAEQPRDEQGKPLGRFFKVQRLVELVNSNFVKHVEEENYVAIDEQMTVYKGTKCPPGLKQYLPSKPIPHGFKNWARGGSVVTSTKCRFTLVSRNPKVRPRMLLVSQPLELILLTSSMGSSCLQLRQLFLNKNSVENFTKFDYELGLKCVFLGGVKTNKTLSRRYFHLLRQFVLQS